MTKPQNFHPSHIVVDWGTTSLRAFLISPDGTIGDRMESERGIQFIADDAYEAELTTAISGWIDTYGILPILALGMVTSRNGWVEVPYVSCPATPADLAKGIVSRHLTNGCPVLLLPGITDPARTPFPDVMRGEETQIVGFGLDKDICVVLPGTHSKWARIGDGRIQGFQTFVTGEIFALLSKHSFIAKAAGDETGAMDWAAFDRGAEQAGRALPETDALLSLLFSARTGILAGQMAATETRDYISGLLIGHEFRQADLCGWIDRQAEIGGEIGIVGNDGLNDRYERVARSLNLTVRKGREEAAIDGALAIASHRKSKITHAA
uniref:2-dehydro-3-deoxygalactonokinase n=1 Tax=Pararhizobium sp. IMCC3301 TaxID=3067904 RepID=UPI002741FE2D|nr:2-dehydro-3-deoxygalactonokinase [Pararhizobium sp. IMCC3301]